MWKNYDPEAGDFKEEVIFEETKNGIYFRGSYISAYLNGQEVRGFCRYGAKAGANDAPGSLNAQAL